MNKFSILGAAIGGLSAVIIIYTLEMLFKRMGFSDKAVPAITGFIVVPGCTFLVWYFWDMITKD